jgi:hypothetical protein
VPGGGDIRGQGKDVSIEAAPSRAFFCLRHGATDWNREGRFQGRTDNPMCDEGIAQAFVAARRLQKHRIDRIVTSPLIRAVKTAEIVAATSATPIAVDEGLAELDFGCLEGEVITDIMKAHNLKTVQDLEQNLTDLNREGFPLGTNSDSHCVLGMEGASFAPSSIWRFLDRHGVTFKKKRARSRAG